MGTLFLVATPIGNLEDVTLRALRVLREADRIFAEDTRKTRVLLTHHGIDASLRSLHAHNEVGRIPEVLALLGEGQSLALVTDAGSPLISDPGSRLCRAVIDADHTLCPIPGPSALLAALQVAGVDPHPFAFLGFLPRKSGPRRKRLEAYEERPETLVLYESPHRIGALLEDAAEVFGARRAAVVRELTKIHEESVRDTLPALAERFRDGTRGELVVVIEGVKRARRSPSAT